MGSTVRKVTFHSEVLSTPQKRVLRKLGAVMTARGFYLGGGTALALYFGHRRSVDFDWFSEAIPDPLLLARNLAGSGIEFSTRGVERGTLHGASSRIRLSFLEYPYGLLDPPATCPEFGCAVASLSDLACMKLSAVSQRGSKKDFVDVHALCTRFKPLEELLAMYRRKYGVRDIGHVIYGLAYFDDADRERMPAMLEGTGWPDVKKSIQTWVRAVRK